MNLVVWRRIRHREDGTQYHRIMLNGDPVGSVVKHSDGNYASSQTLIEYPTLPQAKRATLRYVTRRNPWRLRSRLWSTSALQ